MSFDILVLKLTSIYVSPTSIVEDFLFLFLDIIVL